MTEPYEVADRNNSPKHDSPDLSFACQLNEKNDRGDWGELAQALQMAGAEMLNEEIIKQVKAAIEAELSPNFLRNFYSCEGQSNALRANPINSRPPHLIEIRKGIGST